MHFLFFKCLDTLSKSILCSQLIFKDSFLQPKNISYFKMDNRH